jgi:ElaB/YqjD/DUF883 family membrane-anchored ribosome-binding protein
MRCSITAKEIDMETNASINKAAAGAHDVVDSAANAAINVADEAARKAKPAIDRATQIAHQVVDKAAGVAAPTAEWLSAKADAVLAAPEKLAEGGRTIVTNHPWKILGVAFVVGLLIGRVMR